LVKFEEQTQALEDWHLGAAPNTYNALQQLIARFGKQFHRAQTQEMGNEVGNSPDSFGKAKPNQYLA